jgi:integrase
LEGSTNIGVGNERRYAKRWSKWFGKRLLSSITTEELRHHQAKLRAKMKVNNKTKQPQRQWHDSTINRFFAYLRRAFTLAIKDGLMARNPMSGVKFFPEQHRTRFLSEPELRSLHGVMQAGDWRLVALALEIGLRQSEMFGLRWDCVDIEHGVLTIPRSKNGTTRHVLMTEEARNIMRSFESFAESPFVFPSKHDPLKSLCPDSFLRNKYRPALRRAGIQNSRWHDLRHTCASRKVMAGADLLTVKEWLGHRDFDTTLKYAHLSPAHMRGAVNLGTLAGLLPTVARTVASQDEKRGGESQPIDFVVRPEGLEPPTPRSVDGSDEEETLG